MQKKICNTHTNKLINHGILNFGMYNLLFTRFIKWQIFIKIERRETYKTVTQILDYIANIPEVWIINNMVFPNWIIGCLNDIEDGLNKLIKNTDFWAMIPRLNWIDARGIIIYHYNFLQFLEEIIIEFLNRCDYVILTPPEFMTCTEFWEWILKSHKLSDGRYSRIIFFSKNQARTYKTTAAGIIPLKIAKIQHEFYIQNVRELTTHMQQATTAWTNTRITCEENAGCHNILPFYHDDKTTTELNSDNCESPVITKYDNNNNIIPLILPIQPNNECNIISNESIIIKELDKLRGELISYNLASPDILELETGAILEKINNIRMHLGII